jgi:hypothetical protein
MSGAVCNITRHGEQRRMRFGLLAAAVTVICGACMVVLGTPPLWRLLIFLPAAGAGYGIFQARAKT